MSSNPKKRKRADSGTAADLQVQTSLTDDADGLGPLLVSFPSTIPPPKTPFKIYSRKKSKQDDGPVDLFQDNILVGETPNVEFISNSTEAKQVSSSGCRYVLAVHHRKNKTLTLLSSQSAFTTTPHPLPPLPKLSKSIPPSAPPSHTEWALARTALGTAFGTKKAKAQIAARERNQLDVSAMKGAVDHLISGVTSRVESLPTKEEAQESRDENRLIPPYNAETTDPVEAYPLHDIIPRSEWKALDGPVKEMDDVLNSGGVQECLNGLRQRHSAYLKEQLERLVASDVSGKARKKKLKLVLYISMLLTFRRELFNTKKGVEKSRIHERMSTTPSLTIDSFIERFTEAVRDSTQRSSTTASQTLMHTHILALALHLESFWCDPGAWVKELGQSASAVQKLFESLGCVMRKPSPSERARLGLGDSFEDVRMATLKTPLVFPVARGMKKAKR